MIEEVKQYIKENNIDCSDTGAGGDVFQIEKYNVVFVHQVSGFSIRDISTGEDIGYIKQPDKIR